jgi:hypothetical protein
MPIAVASVRLRDAAAALDPDHLRSGAIPVEKHKLMESAARLIAAKGQRLAAPGNFDAARQQQRHRRSRALLQIAASLSPACALAAAEGDQPVDVTAADRETAANEVYSLLQRRSGSDVVDLYDIALSLHYESYWAYLKALQQQELGDTDAACATLESIQGPYADTEGLLAQRFRQQAAGVPNPAEEMAQQLFDRMAQDAGGEDALQKQFSDLWASVTGVPATDTEDDEDDDSAQERDSGAPVDLAILDLAAETAQCFAERLVDGNFAAAKALLGSALRDVSAAELQQEYESMIEMGRDGNEPTPPEELQVIALNVDAESADPDSAELAYVYVGIHGWGFNEAVSVTVVRENGETRIASLEWGRP